MGRGTEEISLVDFLHLRFWEVETELGKQLLYAGRPLASDDI
jgi:hypothetical protein